MTSCAEVRRELVTAARGELSGRAAGEVGRHLAACPACAAELASLRGTMARLSPHLGIETSPDARLRLRAALDVEFGRQRAAARRRRWLSVLVPAAAAALLAGTFLPWSERGGDGAAAGTGLRVASLPAAPSPATSASSASPAPPVTASSAAAPATPAARAAAGGLDWLAVRQRADGTWAPADDARRETVAAVTGSVVLAFAARGESAWRGPRQDALRRAGDRLAEMVDSGFSVSDADKPLYAEALGVRALAAQFAADRDVMPASARRARSDLLRRAARRLVEWQGDDGGFGYVPRSRTPDAACTLFAAAALAEVRRSGVAQPSGALARAGRYVERLSAEGGVVAYQRPGDRGESPFLTAAASVLDDDLLLAPHSDAALDKVADAVASSAGRDALLAWEGLGALARRGRAGEAPTAAVLGAQRADGAWPAAADARCVSGGDDMTTALGVLALSVARD